MPSDKPSGEPSIGTDVLSAADAKREERWQAAKHHALTTIIHRILGRAQETEFGLSWQRDRTADLSATGLATDLASGQAGILLALVAASGTDDSLTDAVKRGFAWVDRQRQLEGGATDLGGLYRGEGGWACLLAEARAIVDPAGTALNAWSAALASRERGGPARGPSAVACGAAGILLAVLQAAPSREQADVAEGLLRDVVRAAHCSRDGLSWDRLAHAVRPSLGFVNGNAGIDFSLSLAGAMLGIDCSDVLAASIAHSNAEFSEVFGNWPDYERSVVSSIGGRGVAKAASRERGPASELLLPHDSCSWACGAAGLLLSRATVMTFVRDEPTVAACRADCHRASRRLERALNGSVTWTDLSLAHGLAGILLALRAAEPIWTEASGLAQAARDRLTECLESGTADLRLQDDSLFTGMSGIAYALARSEGPTSTPSCIAPASLFRPGNGRPPIRRRVEAEEILVADLPQHSAMPTFRAAVRNGAPLNLRSLTRLSKEIQASTAPLQREALAHELDRVDRAAAQTGSNLAFLRQQANARRADQLFRDVDVAVVLRATLELDATLAELLVLPFDPTSTASPLPEQRTYLLRTAGWTGIEEVGISPLLFHLLSQFTQGRPVLAAIQQVLPQVNGVIGRRRELAALCLNYVRQMSARGLLRVIPRSGVAKALWRVGARKTCRELFPSVR